MTRHSPANVLGQVVHGVKVRQCGNQPIQPASSRPAVESMHESLLMRIAVVGLASLVLMLNTINPAHTAQQKHKSITEAASALPSIKIVKIEDLPKNVADMRAALLDAAASGHIDELQHPFDLNELPPAISRDKVGDPVAHWKKISRDGAGLEILQIIDKLLHLPAAKLQVGPDVENSGLYVWPYLAELNLADLTQRQQFELRTLVPPGDARKIMDSKKWSWWRLSIGADGTWHAFMKFDN